MILYQFEIILVASIVAVACTIPGVFLVLRKMVLVSDAISHAVLFGIVVSFFLLNYLSRLLPGMGEASLASPFLLIGATLSGLLLVFLVELLGKTGLVTDDAAIGLVFPALFSIGVILISKYAGNIHLDQDSVYLGDLAFIPFDRLEVAGIDIGPKMLYVTGTILLINVLFLVLFYKQLTLTTFDMGLAAAVGISPLFFNYALMTMVSLTAVGFFDAVGAILVVALMAAPPAAAYLLTRRLSAMIFMSAGIALFSAIAGYFLAHLLKDASIAGSIATVAGLCFVLSFLFSRRHGVITKLLLRRRQKEDFKVLLLLVHVLNHEAAPNAPKECDCREVYRHLNWEKKGAEKIIEKALKKDLILKEKSVIILSKSGREQAKSIMVS